jgi:TonB family protein
MISAPSRPSLQKIAPGIPALTPVTVPRQTGPESREPSLTQILTLVVWLGCLAVGGVGLTWHYSRPQAARPAPVPIQAEFLSVELTSEPVPPPEEVSLPPAAAKPPPLAPPPAVPPSPPLLPVAEPNPAIAFSVPVAAPARIVEVKAASPVFMLVPAPTPAPAFETLVHGVGEGRQPAPNYPLRALREGQEGKVTVRFNVGENGQVLEAAAVGRSPWPLLNAEAVRVIRERWRFQSGAARLYEVSIHFQLRK